MQRRGFLAEIEDLRSLMDSPEARFYQASPALLIARLREDAQTADIDSFMQSVNFVFSEALRRDLVAFLAHKIQENGVYTNVYKQMLGDSLFQKLNTLNLVSNPHFLQSFAGFEIVEICQRFIYRLWTKRPYMVNTNNVTMLRTDKGVSWLNGVLQYHLSSLNSVPPSRARDETMTRLATLMIEPYRANILALAEEFEEVLQEYISQSEAILARRLAVSGFSHVYLVDRPSDQTWLEVRLQRDGTYSYTRAQQPDVVMHAAGAITLDRESSPEYKQLIRRIDMGGFAVGELYSNQFESISPHIYRTNGEIKHVGQGVYLDKVTYRQLVHEIYRNFFADCEARAAVLKKSAYVKLNAQQLIAQAEKIAGTSSLTAQIRIELFSRLHAEILGEIFDDAFQAKYPHIKFIEVSDEIHYFFTLIMKMQPSFKTKNEYTVTLVPAKPLDKAYTHCQVFALCFLSSAGLVTNELAIDPEIFFTNALSVFNPHVNHWVFSPSVFLDHLQIVADYRAYCLQYNYKVRHVPHHANARPEMDLHNMLAARIGHLLQVPEVTDDINVELRQEEGLIIASSAIAYISGLRNYLMAHQYTSIGEQNIVLTYPAIKSDYIAKLYIRSEYEIDKFLRELCMLEPSQVLSLYAANRVRRGELFANSTFARFKRNYLESYKSELVFKHSLSDMFKGLRDGSIFCMEQVWDYAETYPKSRTAEKVIKPLHLWRSEANAVVSSSTMWQPAQAAASSVPTPAEAAATTKLRLSKGESM